MRLHARITGLILVGALGFTNQTFAQVTPNSVTLTWTAPGDDSLIGPATRYDIRYSTSLITSANFASATAVTSPPAPVAPTTSQSFNVTGLQPSTAYWFAIKTQDDAGNWSGLSNVVSKTTLAAPDVTRPAPIALNVTAVTDTTATLGWTAVGDDSLTGTATSYDIRYSTSAITTASWATATQVSGEPAPQAPGSPQTYTVGGLARQRQYYFAIKAADDAGNVSALSNVPSGTTTDTVAPMSIKDLAAGFVWLGWPSAGSTGQGRAQ
jgi:chitodextrinase